MKQILNDNCYPEKCVTQYIQKRLHQYNTNTTINHNNPKNNPEIDKVFITIPYVNETSNSKIKKIDIDKNKDGKQQKIFTVNSVDNKLKNIIV